MKLLISRTFWVFVLAGLSGAALLHISQRVQDAEVRLGAIKAQAAEEQENIRVLSAEWEYLNSPARLEILAAQYLDLVPPDTGFTALESDELPPRNFKPEFTSSPFTIPPQEMSDSVVIQPVFYVTPQVKPSPSIPPKNFNALLRNLNEERD